LLSLARINKKENATNFGEQAKGGTRSPSLALSLVGTRARLSCVLITLSFDLIIIYVWSGLHQLFMSLGHVLLGKLLRSSETRSFLLVQWEQCGQSGSAEKYQLGGIDKSNIPKGSE